MDNLILERFDSIYICVDSLIHVDHENVTKHLLTFKTR